eukprot:TRINITY_DN1299_c1_g1_i1.p1 TRINITY_DN1299_c1_g1~~TRINITY_DN1299_c1_g1_i1.p1  ORF type:complete len:174 (-),score=33.57 TRINITY_DN1299_c1_g1_i1:181-681(-)
MRKFYHGTTIEAISPISNQGFKITNQGRLMNEEGNRMGPGVYMASKEHAEKISLSTHCNNHQACVVFEIEVNLGKTKEIPLGQNDYDGSWQNLGFDSAHGIHPPWAIITTNFDEWVVKNSNQVKITALYLWGGVYKGDINLPGCNIYIKGTVSFSGNIVGGSIVIG